MGIFLNYGILGSVGNRLYIRLKRCAQKDTKFYRSSLNIVIMVQVMGSTMMLTCTQVEMI